MHIIALYALLAVLLIPLALLIVADRRHVRKERERRKLERTAYKNAGRTKATLRGEVVE